MSRCTKITDEVTPLKLELAQGFWSAEFHAMASPCQVLIDTDDKMHALHLAQLAQNEALRVEKKFSRYRKDNLIYKINHSKGKPIQVDEELAGLLDYANTCYEISNGHFDITSGILRRVWKFDCSDNVPSQSKINSLLKYIGWNKVNWETPFFTLPENMEIDLGGIGKEYSVDRSAQILQANTSESFLINYGGDLFVNKARKNQQGWLVGIEDPEKPSHSSADLPSLSQTKKLYELSKGGMATSGDSKRYILKDNIRYSHILNPTTGWPVRNAPHSITVVSSSCTEAGILSTLAMLEEENADKFLQQQEVTYWCS